LHNRESLLSAVFDSIQDGQIERGRETILVGEDEEAPRLLVRNSPDRLGYTIMTAAGRPSALMVVGREGRLDPVITDVVMPAEMDYATCETTIQPWTPEITST
jgi:CheY-like chemotaxis protein